MKTLPDLRRSTARLLLVGAGSSVLLAMAAATEARAQGVRLTLAPAAEYVWWDKTTGIEDGTLFGGRLGADFGSLLSVSGYYHRGTGFGVQRDSLSSAGQLLVGPRQTNTGVSTYGGNLALRLSSARLAPFISAGAGIIRFEPDSVKRVEQINYRYGGGFQYDASSNIRAMVMVEDSRFRLAPGALFPAEPGSMPFADRQATRSNWTVSAGLGVAVGGSVGDDDPETERWSMGSVPIEPFVGRLEFDDPSMPRQALAGVRTGVDFGQYVGLRGFYWQGRSSDLKERQDMQSYGGEAQFNFTRSRGPSPFLVLGAGRLDYGEDYRDNAGRTREDETALIVGAGVALRLADAFRLNIAVRDYVRGPQELDSLSSIDKLTNNFMYTVGLGIDLGRSRSDVVAPRDERMTSRDRELRRMGDDARRSRAARIDSIQIETRVVMMPSNARMITLPVPVNGELYVRYGDSTTMRPSITAKAPDSATLVRTVDPTDAMIQSLKARIDSLEARLARTAPAVPSAPPAAPTPPTVIILPAAPAADRGATVVTRNSGMPVEQMTDGSDIMGMQVRSVSPYVAGFDQLVIGAQLDAGPVFGVSALRLVPDFAIGLGDNPSMSLAVGAQYNFQLLKINAPGTYRPYVRAGLGFLAASGSRDSEFGVNLAYGLTYGREASGADSVANNKRPLVFVEHQGINFYSTNRFLLGLRFNTR